MTDFTFKSPDGKSYTVSGPPGATQEQAFQVLQAQISAGTAKTEAPKSSLDKAREIVKPTGVHGAVEEAVGEPAAQALTGIGSSIVGGVAGLARGAGAGAAALSSGKPAGEAFDVGVQEARETLESVQQAGTYQPKSQTGKTVSETVNKPFVWLAGKGSQAGTAVGGATESAARTLGASPETARRIGGGAAAATETAVQAAPAAVLGGVAKLGRAVSADDAALAARGAQVGEVPRGTSAKPEGPRTAETGQAPPQGAAPAAAPTTPEGRAQAYAVRIGLDWSRLGAGTRAALTQVARDGRLDQLDPAAVERKATLEGLRIPVGASRGQLTRDPVQLRREAVTSKLPEGQPIRDVDIGANRDIQANLEALRGRAAAKRGGLHEPVTPEGQPAASPSLRAPTMLPTQVGSSVQTALRGAAGRSEANYRKLFKAAEETEPNARVPLNPLTNLLTENPDIQHIGWVNSWLNKAARAKAGTTGEAVPLTDVSLKELNDLRKLAVKYQKGGGTDAHYAGLVKEQIDQAMESAPAGAKAWKAAIGAFKEHKGQFANQRIVRDLVEQKRGTPADRATALERTWATVAKGSREDLLTVKKSLMKAGPQGRRAWNDLRGETVNRILEDARNVTARDETERAILTEAALRRSMNSIPRENLRELLGTNLLRELDNIVRARSITTRSPIPGRTTESGTVPNSMVMKVTHLLEHVPGVKYAVGAAKGVKKLGEIGEASRTARRAVQTSMMDLQRGGGTLPPAPTIGDVRP